MEQLRRVTRGGVACAVLALCIAVPGLRVLAHPGIDRQIADLDVRIAQDPSDAHLYVRRAELHRIHRDWKLAEADYRRARELDSDLHDVTLGLGLLQLDAGKPAEAIETLNRFLQVRPSHSAGLAARARAKVQVEQYASAADDYTTALAHLDGGPGQPGYYLERARALVSASDKNLERAVAGLDEGLRALGQPVTLQLLAIDYELELGRTEAALTRLDAIAAMSSRKETWLIRRGEILEGAGRVEEARRAYLDSLDAITLLRPGRRNSRAVKRLQENAEAALKRLGQSGPAGGPEKDG